MNKKRAIRLLGGATTVVVMSAALLAWSGVVYGLEKPALGTQLASSGQPSETRVLLAQADAAPASTPVSYTSEQADRGEEVYYEDCVECHGEDIEGGLLGGPPLRGLAFEEKYAKGAPAGCCTR